MYLDSNVIQAARKIYQTYLNLYSRIPKQPRGVVLNRKTFRGQLVFKEKPLLLPGEYFVPLHHLEARMM